MEDIAKVTCGEHENFEEIIDYSLQSVGVCEKKKRSEWRTNMKRTKQSSNSWKVSEALWKQHLHFLGFDEKVGNYTKQEISLNKVACQYRLQHEEIDRLEEELDNIQQGKGYISESQHEEIMMEQLKEQQEIIRANGDTIGKLRSIEEGLRSKIDSQERRYEDMKKYYEQQIQTLV
tara:strand:- start:59 stop:586 length:528 start_codon:yes stop_codon:yes gene_type:complete